MYPGGGDIFAAPMNSIARGSLAALLVLFAIPACGGAQKPAEEPANTEESASADGGSSSEAPGAPTAESAPTPGSGKPVGGDDAAKAPTPCTGFEIPDLLAVISQSSCEAPDNKAMSDPKEMKDVLEIKVALDSAVVAPGSSAQVTVTYKNKGKTDLPLYFVVDPEPRFDLEAYTLKGDHADSPSTPAPPLPSEVNNAQAPEPKISKVTLAPLGTAKLSLKWNAVKYKWASKERAKGALPGRGYPRDPAGPLKKGKYVLRVSTPMTGVLAGIDKEVSQPRTQVTVGGH
jgi:hypothetical protein